MNQTEIILCLAAIVVVGADIALRLVFAPHRGKKIVEDLLETMIVPDVAPKRAGTEQADFHTTGPLEENLIRHFEQSVISRNVLEIVGNEEKGLCETEVLAAVNGQLAERRKRELPISAVRKVVMILLGSEFIAHRDGKFQITDAGRLLNARLQARTSSSVELPAFASS